jgi:hypothetical protein
VVALSLPEPVRDALEAWLAAHDEVAPDAIEGLYVVGSVALDDWTPHSDIDVVAVVADPSDPDLFGDLAAAHELVRERVAIPIDGPFIAWGDLVVPPVAVHRPWVLDGEYHVDGESFEINPVTWYTLATYGIAMRGEHRDRLGVYAHLADRRSWVADNLDSYWRGVADALAAGVADSDEVEWGGEILEWVALGVARMLYTFETGDVISKSGAGRWAARRIPAHETIFDRAVAVRSTRGTVSRGELLACADVAREIVVAVTGH